MKKQQSNLLNDYHLLSFDALDSTNEEAKRLARGGGCRGAVIWAKKQSEGKGRMGRSWVSSEGNLFVSVLLQPEKPLKEFAQLSFVTAVAVIESLEALLAEGHALQCKWPNDILLNGRKLGGILLESFQTGEGSQPWVVVGVGVNVDSYPPRTEFPATCLKEAGVELVRRQDHPVALHPSFHRALRRMERRRLRPGAQALETVRLGHRRAGMRPPAGRRDRRRL